MLRKKPNEPPKPSRSLAVVVADDVADIQVLLATWLQDAGHTVRCVSSGRDLVKAVRERAPDLVITDIVMPDGDGHDAIASVSRLCPDTRIIAMSGGGREMPADPSLRLAKGLGADAVLPKPFSKEQVLATVARFAT